MASAHEDKGLKNKETSGQLNAALREFEAVRGRLDAMEREMSEMRAHLEVLEKLRRYVF